MPGVHVENLRTNHGVTAHIKAPPFTPNVFVAEENKTAALCMCKQSGNSPFCDGGHTKL